MNNFKSEFTIFIVEDDVWYSEILEYHLSLNPDYIIKKFKTGEECLKALHLNPGAICLDYSLPDHDGKEMVKRIKRTHAHVPIIIVSGQDDVQVAIDMLQEENVQDYIVKDDDTKDRLWKSIIRIREKATLKNEVVHLKEELGRKYDFQKTIIGKSESIKKVFSMMQKACDNNITVSVTGETGTGKELVAKSIHYGSNRSRKSFVAVNVTAIPKELIESELFGHEKGAFTGAQSRRIGKFEEAHQGTIFLDEIADMDTAMQGKLLRVLQEREVIRVGGNKTTKIDVRIIVATHKDLLAEVKAGRFREDLYYRLLGLPVELPALRERKDDILILAKHFADSFCKENKKSKKTFSPESRKKLMAFYFPGNIRELKAMIDLAVVMADSDVIEVDNITFNTSASVSDFLHEENTLKGYNSAIIAFHLEKYNNDVTLVAQKLDIGKSTLYKMIQKGTV
jgi:two-component system response regulator AtoC